MNIEDVYKQLTDVDINQQKILWDERGKGYYGEYRVFCELYGTIPGHCKILMNLNIPVIGSKTTEIDLVLIHETGLYVFEIKHYKGTIYGKNTDTTWTQYFRTAKNNTFRNPILQNDYHIAALKKLFPNTPIHSFIVFTSYDCDIKVNNSRADIDVCHLQHILPTIKRRFSESSVNYSIEDIDKTFNTLSIYSKMKDEVPINIDIADFSSWVQPCIAKLEEKKETLEIEISKVKEQSNELKKAKNKGIIFNVFVAVFCVIVSAFGCFNIIQINKNELNAIIQANTNELNDLKQKFLHIDESDNEYMKPLQTYVNVSNISLVPSMENTVSFRATLSITNPSYGITITETAKYIVIKNDGTVIEYNVFGEHLQYNESVNTFIKDIKTAGTLKTIKFYGISDINDIMYIKITGIRLFLADGTRNTIQDNLEIELYSN